MRAVVHSLWLLLLSYYCWTRLLMRPPIRDLLKIGSSAAACAGVAYLVLEWHGDLLGLLLAPIAGALTYLICLRLVSAIPADDVEVLGYNLGSALPAPFVALAMRLIEFVAPRQPSEAS